MRFRSIPLILIWCALMASALGQTSTRPLLIRDVRVFDGERVLEHRSVLLKNGRISRVGGRENQGHIQTARD